MVLYSETFGNVNETDVTGVIQDSTFDIIKIFAALATTAAVKSSLLPDAV